MLERFRLDGRVALVTGAGRGIGRGIALGFAEAGADVVCAARTESEVNDTADAIRALGRRAIAVRTDVTEAGELEALAARAREFGKVDILVNNAGGWPPSSILENDADVFRRAFSLQRALGVFDEPKRHPRHARSRRRRDSEYIVRARALGRETFTFEAARARPR